MSSLDRLFALFLRTWHQDVVEQLAGEIARRCHATMRTRVLQRALQMSPEMQRGYLRAHAMECVATEVDAATSQLSVADHLRPSVVDAAVAQLIGMVLCDLSSVSRFPEARAAAA